MLHGFSSFREQNFDIHSIATSCFYTRCFFVPVAFIQLDQEDAETRSATSLKITSFGYKPPDLSVEKKEILPCLNPPDLSVGFPRVSVSLCLRVLFNASANTLAVSIQICSKPRDAIAASNCCSKYFPSPKPLTLSKRHILRIYTAFCPCVLG